MSKEIHAIRLWAWRDGARTLVSSLEKPDARREALARVSTLQGDPAVSRIEMREHIVVAGDSETSSGRRGSLVWERRTDGRWRTLPAGNLHAVNRHGL